MDFRGELVAAAKDWSTGKWTVTFTCEESALPYLDELKGKDLAITAKKYRNRRSLDSNAYAWVLIQKIAEAIHSDKQTVYLDMLKQYSRAFEHIIVSPEAVEAVTRVYATTIDLGEVTVDGKTGRQLQIYFGSSTFDTKEMSVFIDGLVETCKELGLETLPPDELERMKQAWI